MSVKLSLYPILEFVELLRSFHRHPYQVRSFRSPEWYFTGLLAEMERKSSARIAGLSESVLYRLMDEVCQDLRALNQQRKL